MTRIEQAFYTMEHITEARRYLATAREILRDKAGKKDRFYTDRQFVRMAGNTAWGGVLEALGRTFYVHQATEQSRRPDIEAYGVLVGKRSQIRLTALLNAYDTLQKAMGWDGNLNVKIARVGLSEADRLITWCERVTKQNQKREKPEPIPYLNHDPKAGRLRVDGIWYAYNDNNELVEM